MGNYSATPKKYININSESPKTFSNDFKEYKGTEITLKNNGNICDEETKQLEMKKFIGDIMQIGIPFAQCFKWNIIMSLFFTYDQKLNFYASFYYVKDYNVQIKISLNKSSINDVKLFKIDQALHITVKNRKDDIIDGCMFPFNLLHDKAEILDMYLYKDANTSKHLLFTVDNNIVNSCAEFKFDTFVLMVENWIYWATKQNDKIIQLKQQKCIELAKQNDKVIQLKQQNCIEHINKNIQSTDFLNNIVQNGISFPQCFKWNIIMPLYFSSSSSNKKIYYYQL